MSRFVKERKPMSKVKRDKAGERLSGARHLWLQDWPRPPGEKEGVPTFRAPPSFAELLEWQDALTAKPDADATVLMWIVDCEGHGQWESGWWTGEGERWCFCESGGDVEETVTHWALPEGPGC